MAEILSQEEAIFHAALEIDGDPQRAAYVAAACGEHRELKKRVEALLRRYDDSAGPLDRSVGAMVGTTAQPLTEGPGTRIGPYKLKEQIGEGGMGLVFVADQQQPIKRRVALKVIKPGMDSKQVIARFQAERQALAMMDHPNIAHVLDAGTTDSGRPYFVMELVKGIPITEYCDRERLTTRRRLELFLSVCQAVQHAHQKGIIHRDIKPTNVLVTVHDVTPVVKIIDFGIAKAMGQQWTEHSVYTGFAQFVGTPMYMSPEQAGMSGLDVDTRCDIYSLGVLLYELVAGTTPFDAEMLKKLDFDEVRRIIREDDPPRPSVRLSTLQEGAQETVAEHHGIEPRRLSRDLRGELDWIVMKALEKDRSRRFETANSFAADVQRFLNDEPVQACPPTARYRFKKFLRRNKGPVLAASLVLLALMAGFTGTTWGLLNAEQNRQNAEEALKAETEARAAEKQAREQAMAALRSMTDEIVQNQMARETSVRDEVKEFLRKIIKHFEGFAAITANDAESRAIRAEGYANVGVIRHRLGELAEAEAALVDSVLIYKQLVAEFPDRSEYRQELARCHSNLGILFRATGQLKEAEAFLTVALAIYKQLAADIPTRPELRIDLARVYNNLGNLLRVVNRLAESEGAYANASNIYQQLAVDFPTRSGIRMELARCYNNRGDLLRIMGRLKEAESFLADALAIQKQLATDFPTRAEFRQELAGIQTNMGVLLRATGRLKEAEDAYTEGGAIYKRLAADFPALPEYRHLLALSQNTLARLFADTGRPKNAEAAYSDALAIQQRLVADFPTRPEFRLQLARTHNNLGSLLQGLGRLPEAETGFVSALTLAKQLTADHPTPIEYRQELASSHNNLGVVFRVTGRLEQAQAAYAEAAAIRKQLVADHPTQPDLRHRLAGTLGNLAIVCNQRGDFPEAKRYLDEAMPHHRAALKGNPRHSDYRKFYRINLRALAAANAWVNDQAGAVLIARTSQALGWDAPIDTYNGARNLAQCIPIVQKLKQLDAAQRLAAEQFYADQAMAMLRDAVAKGWTNTAQMKKDTDLDGLRQREDFQQMLIELERK